MAQSKSELTAIRKSVETVGRLSDSLFRVGRVGIGIDGILSWIPGVGELYSTAAGGFIVYQGWRAGAPQTILVSASLLLLLRTFVSGVPIAGAIFSDFFTAHKWAASMVIKEIDKKLELMKSSREILVLQS